MPAKLGLAIGFICLGCYICISLVLKLKLKLLLLLEGIVEVLLLKKLRSKEISLLISFLGEDVGPKNFFYFWLSFLLISLMFIP